MNIEHAAFFLCLAFVCFKNEAEKPKILERVVCLFVCCEWSWYMLRDDDEIIRTIFQFFIIFTFLLHRKPHTHCFNLLFCSEQAFFFRRMRCPWSMRFIVYICSIYSRISEFLRQYRTKKWLFQHVTYVVKRPKYIRYVHNIGLFVRLHSVCFNFFFILIAFSYSGRFFFVCHGRNKPQSSSDFMYSGFGNGGVGAEFETNSHKRVKCIIIFVCLQFLAIKTLSTSAATFTAFNVTLMLIIMISFFLSLSRNTTY